MQAQRVERRREREPIAYSRKFGLPTMREMVEAVSARVRVPVEAIYGRNQRHEIATARQIAYFCCGEICQRTANAVAKHFGRDHTTVLYGQNRIQERMAEEPWIRRAIEDLRFKYGLDG